MAHDVQNRFYEAENNETQYIVIHIIIAMFTITVMLWICVFFGCCDSNSNSRPMCDGIVTATILDAIFGGNRRERALRPFGR